VQPARLPLDATAAAPVGVGEVWTWEGDEPAVRLWDIDTADPLQVPSDVLEELGVWVVSAQHGASGGVVLDKRAAGPASPVEAEGAQPSAGAD
jgi:hypothetical protein